MPLAPVATKNVKYKGCPSGCRHVVFTRPNGSEMAALVGVDPSWDVSLFVEAEFYRFFLVAVSPDKQKLQVERWLPRHGPKRLIATTQAEQSAALGGKHAGNATAAELADAAVATLTDGDAPAAVPPRGTALVALTGPDPDGAGRKEKLGDYRFQTAGQSLALRVQIKSVLGNRLLKTKGTEATLVAAFCNSDLGSAYFLFDQGSDYLLESLDWWGGRYRRQEATTPKATLDGLSNEDAAKAMVPDLAPDQP